MSEINQEAYNNALKAAEMSVDPIQLDHVTSDNWEEKLAEKNIEVVKDVNGNTTGYYVNTLMSVVEPGQFSTSQKVQVYVVPHYDNTSTESNTKVTFETMPAGSTNTSAGAQTVYMDKNDALNTALKAAGYDVDYSNIPPEVINEMWENYYAQENVGGNIIRNAAGALIDSQSKGIPIGSTTLDLLALEGEDKAIMVMKAAEFSDEKMAWLGMEDMPLARLLKAAASVGLTDAEDLFIDDPATKALFRTEVEVGDYVQLTAVGDRDGTYYDEEWLEAFIKPMLMAEMAWLDVAIYTPTAEQWETDYVYNEYGNIQAIPYLLDTYVHNSVNKHINIWAACYEAGRYTNNKVSLWGAYISPEMDWEVLLNDTAHGYARLLPHGTFYSPPIRSRWYKYDTHEFTAQAGQEMVPGSTTPLILIYDQDAFLTYLGDLGSTDAMSFVSSHYILFSNGSVRKNDLVEKTRPDAIMVTPESTINDIIVQIENDTVWPDNRIVIPIYDPATDTTVNHYYYPTTPGVSDPREVNWPDFQIPEIVSPVNEILKYPTIPSAISTPIQNDPVIPTAGSNQFWTIYMPSDAQMGQLGAELWNQNAIQVLKQTFVNPTDGIISWSQVFLAPTQAYTDYIYLGDYKTSVSGVPVVTDPKVYKYFGIIDVPRFFEDYRDFTETEVSAYLPFIGFVDLDPRDVIGCQITLEYYMDVITGTCVATLSPKVGNVAECCYQFTGNCGVQLPITAADRSRLLSGLLTGAVSGAKAGSVGGPGGMIAGGIIGGAIGAASGAFGVQKSNGFSANAGALTKYKRPYILIHRSIPADPILYDAYYGNPSNVTATLKNLHGFTKVHECYIDIPRATDAEKAMLEAMLKQGVILP